MPEGTVTTTDRLDAHGVARVGLSGLTETEARAFHRMFVVSFLVFLGIAIVAHWLVWQWRPWIPGAAGYPVAAAVDAPAAMPDAARLAVR